MLLDAQKYIEKHLKKDAKSMYETQPIALWICMGAKGRNRIRLFWIISIIRLFDFMIFN